MKILMTILLSVDLVISPQIVVVANPRKPFVNVEFLEQYYGDHEFFKITESVVEETVDNSAQVSPQFITESIAVCNNSHTKSYMDWTMTSETSRQGRFMREFMTIRDGLLYDKDGFIGVALGSYFGDIGSRFIFTLDTGIVLHLIKVEQKSDRHTINGCQQYQDGSVIEFVIDLVTNKFYIGDNTYVAGGSFNNLPQFKGSIVKIDKVLN